MKTLRKIISVLLVLVMVLAMAVPTMAKTRDKERVDMYFTVDNIYTQIGFAVISADEVTKTKENISFPGYGSPVEVYKAKGQTTLEVSEGNVLLDVCIYRYEPGTGSKTLIGKADSEKWGSLDFYTTKGLIKQVKDPGTYVITGTYADGCRVPLAVAVEVEAGESVTENNENTGGNKLLYFKDVPKTHWAHNAVMDMVKEGLFTGTTQPDANGAALFDPNATMTSGQFVTVVTRYLCPDKVENNRYLEDYHYWYTPYTATAEEIGIADNTNYDHEVYKLPITREYMAKILVKVCNKSGENLGANKYTDFPDYDKVSPEYRDYVAIAYAEGLLCGVDNAGTFNPQGTLTRAQAATVLYRLLDPSTRVEI